MDDADLFRRYSVSGSEEAFRLLLERNVPMVYSTALRKTSNPSMAEDVTQVVFIILAKKARRLSKRTILAGWLHRTTHHIAVKALRQEKRRREREKKAVQMQDVSAESQWKSLTPFLDDALAELREGDRSAVILRYFQNRTFSEVGAALRISDDTAQKRVSRSLEKLRRILLKRGVVVSVVTLGSLAATNGAQFSPGYLATQVATGALRDAKLSTSVGSLLELAMRPLLSYSRVLASGSIGLGLVLAVAAVMFVSPQRTAAPSKGMSIQNQIVRHLPRSTNARAQAPITPVAAISEVKEVKSVGALSASNAPAAPSNSNAPAVPVIARQEFRRVPTKTVTNNASRSSSSAEPPTFAQTPTPAQQPNFSSRAGYNTGPYYTYPRSDVPSINQPLDLGTNQSIPQAASPQQNNSTIPIFTGSGRAWAPAQRIPKQKKGG